MVRRVRSRATRCPFRIEPHLQAGAVGPRAQVIRVSKHKDKHPSVATMNVFPFLIGNLLLHKKKKKNKVSFPNSPGSNSFPTRVTEPRTRTNPRSRSHTAGEHDRQKRTCCFHYFGLVVCENGSTPLKLLFEKTLTTSPMAVGSAP